MEPSSSHQHFTHQPAFFGKPHDPADGSRFIQNRDHHRLLPQGPLFSLRDFPHSAIESEVPGCLDCALVRHLTIRVFPTSFWGLVVVVAQPG